MRKILRLGAVTAVGMILLSCAPPPRAVRVVPPPPRVAYLPPPPAVYSPPRVVYWPRPPLRYGGRGYARSAPAVRPPPQRVHAPPPSASYGRSTDAHARTPRDPRLQWRPSPRWATARKKARTGAVEPPPPKAEARTSARKPDPKAKFRAAKAKAAKVGVENLTQEDIAGLSSAELKQLRGY